MDERTLTRAALAAFRELGFDVDELPPTDRSDGRIRIGRDGRHHTFDIEMKARLTPARVQERPSDDVIYVTDHVSARTADALRRRGAQFMDIAGNAFINSGGWYVDVRGRRPAGARLDRGPAEAPINLFSAKRAQVIMALLTWSELLEAPVRDIAGVAGVSVGIAQSTNSELRRRSLWPDAPATRANLIDGWSTAFPETLARSLTIRTVRAEQLDRFFGPVLVSGEAAPSAQMRAAAAVVYVAELTTELLMENRWRTDGPPNLTIRRRFWRGSGTESMEAPPLIVYGDLRASDDPRTRSVAADYRSRL